MPEPRPNHARTMMRKPEDRSDSKDATPFDKFQKNMIFMEKANGNVLTYYTIYEITHAQ